MVNSNKKRQLLTEKNARQCSVSTHVTAHFRLMASSRLSSAAESQEMAGEVILRSTSSSDYAKAVVLVVCFKMYAKEKMQVFFWTFKLSLPGLLF